MRVTYDKLNKMTQDFAKRHTWESDLFVVVRQGCTEKEMLESPYKLEVVEWQDGGIEPILGN